MPNSNVWKTQINHIVVLMMENRSFDHLLGDFRRFNPACEGIDANQPGSNTVSQLPGRVFRQEPDHELRLPFENGEAFDPMHEFSNVCTQMGALAAPTMNGFAQDVYDTYKEHAVFGKDIADLTQRVMNYIPFGDTPAQDPLPAIQGLARAFSVCDHWFSPVPGPTWPNRFFAMMGSAHGRVLMPSSWKDAMRGIQDFCDQICEESIFSLLHDKGVSTGVYGDGSLPYTMMVKQGGKGHDIQRFKEDVKTGRLPSFVWIEPDYSFKGSDGNSQHPPEDLTHGDAFIADIYNTLRANNAVWDKTLFVLLYDEHGGFYDHVVPPTSVAPDNIESDAEYEGRPFDFRRLGPRVPAIAVSPWVEAGIDKTVYDHTSVLAFVCDRFGLNKSRLGQRVAQAKHFGNAPIWCQQPRANTPAQLTVVKTPQRTRALLEHETGLAAETRLLLQGMHAYLTGQDVRTAWSAALGIGMPAEGARALRLTLPRLDTLADEVSHALAQLDLPRPGAPSPALRPAFKPNEPLRLLCLHGIGHGDAGAGWQADPGWQEKWKQVITRNLQASGVDTQAVQIQMLRYDDLFGDGPSKLQMLRAVPLLLRAMAAEVAGTRAFGLQIPEMLRWTAGMVVQWIEDEDLRAKLRSHLQAAIASFQPHAVLAHSLGSLISYDTLRRAVVQGGDALQQIDGRMFVSFGSQIAHPVVMREVWGGKVAPLHDSQGKGIAAWFHLYNQNDRVLTRPISTQDPRRADITTTFDIPFPDEWVDLNHSADVYLDHAATRTQLWPALARGLRTRSLSMPAIVTRAPVRKKRALLVGINEYPDAAMRLNGCVNDVFLISKTLQQSGYDPADIRLVLDERATRAEIASRLQWLVEDARPGDERVFFYSGHGAQIPKYGSSGEADRMDETLVPYDFDWNDDTTQFTDKSFREFYSHLPFGRDEGDVSFSVVFDCCHAGGMTRGGARVRGINPPNDIRHRMLRWDENSHDWVGREWREQARGVRPFTAEATKGQTRLNLTRRGQGSASDLRIVEEERFKRQCALYGHDGPYMPLLMYAAREDELASEYDHGAQSYGAFTYALVEQLRKRQSAPLSFEELLKKVSVTLKRRHFTQQPELVGPRTVRDSAVPWKLKLK